MSNLVTIPIEDDFETTLSSVWTGGTGVVNVNSTPSGTMPVGQYSYIVVDPGKINMQVAKIDSWVTNTSFNVSSISVAKGSGVNYSQQTHAAGAIVRFSNNYQFWKDILDAINSKADLSSASFQTILRAPVYADATARDAGIPSPANGMLIYNTALGVFQQYVSGAWTDIAAGSTPNASTTVAGKIQLPDDAAVTAGTATGSTGATNIPTNEQIYKSVSLKGVAGPLVDANEFVINQGGADKRIAASLVAEYVRNEQSGTLIAGENLTANDLGYMDSDGTVWKTVRRATTSAQIGTTTGLDSSLNYNPIQTEYMSDDKVVVAYKKSSDDRIYARIVTFSRLTQTVGTEQVISTAMNGSDGVNMCVLSASLFVVTYRKLSDTFQYAVACTVSGTTITAGSEVLMYGIAVAGGSAVSGSICKVSATSFLSLPVANTALDPIAIVGTISGTVITAGTAVALEATTMNGSTRCCYIQDGVVAAFWDNSTNIKGVILEISGTTITANTVLDTGFAGSLLGGDRVMYIDGGRILIIRNGNNILVNTVNVPDQVAWTTMTVSSTSAYVISNDNANSSYTCPLYIGNNILAIANQKVGDGDVRFRTFDLGVASVKPIIDATIAATAGEMALAKLNSTSNKFFIAWRETGTTNANFSLYWDTSKQFVGSVKTTTSAAGTVPMLSSGVVGATGLTAGLPYYVGDAGAIATSGTRQIGVALSSTSLLLN